MQCHRWLLNIRWQEHNINEAVKSTVGFNESLMETVKIGKLKIFGHIAKMVAERLLKLRVLS